MIHFICVKGLAQRTLETESRLAVAQSWGEGEEKQCLLVGTGVFFFQVTDATCQKEKKTTTITTTNE